jgi:L1 cell adhesion molecule like protein
MIAGLNVMRIVSAPAAIAIACVVANKSNNPRHVVVFDMGAGMLDVAIVRIEGSVCTVVKTAGSVNPGGSDIDAVLVERFVPELGDLQRSRVALRKLREECERAKIALSTSTEAHIDIPPGARTITRAELDEACEELFQSALDPLRELFADSAIRRGEIATVILVGGSTKIPRLRQLIADFFRDDVELLDADDHAISVVDGAAMRGAMLKGDAGGVLGRVVVRDSTPLSLGISLASGAAFVLIPRGSVLPAQYSTAATTFRDWQLNIGFDIVQGERQLARDCIKLGHVTVEGIEKARRGVPMILVEMELNEDGILIVMAKDLKTDATITARIQNRGNLSRENVERLLADADEERARDPDLREKAEAKSELAFFLDRAKVAFDAEVHKRKLKFAEQEKCRLAIVTYRDWLETHQNESLAVYNDKYAQVSRLVNEVVAVQ